MVGFTVTYPKDTAPHSRNIRVTTIWSDTSQDYALPIPPGGPPDSFTQNADGTTTFTGTVNDSIDRCDPELTARTLAIGPCASGNCPPARFIPNENAARLGLGEEKY
jgi:streptogramin lyase